MLVAGLVLLAIAPAIAAAHAIPLAPRVGYAHPGASSKTVAMNLTDAPSFAPSSLVVPSNSTVNLHLTNVGSLAHTFTLENTNQSGTPLKRSWTPLELYQYFQKFGSQVNVSVAPGTSVWENLSYPVSTTALSFEFVSVVPYQFQAGMFGFLNITAAGPVQSLSVNTTNSLSFVPSLLSATPPASGGATNLKIVVTNLGNFPHTFTLSAAANQTLATVAGIVPLVNLSVNASPGATVSGSFTVPKPGVYEFACTIAGHFQAGMFGFLYVGVAVPKPAPPPSTAIVQGGVLAGAGVLLGIGIVLATASGFAGRFSRRPPREPGHP